MSVVVGSVLEGVVRGITAFGAFVELPGGVTGLVHISEVADAYVRDVKDYLKEQDRVKVKVIHVDPKGKIGLSIKQVGAQEGGAPAVAAKPAVPFKPPAKPFRKDIRPPRAAQAETFEDKLAKFIKESDQKQSEFRRSTDAKRGGRGTGRG
jgi:S1 RNA binding domain protein